MSRHPAGKGRQSTGDFVLWDRVHNRPADIYTPPEDTYKRPLSPATPAIEDLVERLKQTASILNRTPADVLRMTVAMGGITPAEARALARAAGIEGW